MRNHVSSDCITLALQSDYLAHEAPVIFLDGVFERITGIDEELNVSSHILRNIPLPLAEPQYLVKNHAPPLP